MISKKFTVRDKKGKVLWEDTDMSAAFDKGKELFKEQKEELYIVKEDTLAIIKN